MKSILVNRLDLANADKDNPIFLGKNDNGKNTSFNYYDKYLNPMFDKPFIRANEFYKGFAIVVRENGKNIINEQGKYLLDNFYKDIGFVTLPKNEYPIFDVINSNNLHTLVDKEGNFITDKWFIDISSFMNGNYGIVTDMDFRPNVIDKKGNLLFKDEIFSSIHIIPKTNCLFLVKKDKKFNIIDKNLNYLSKDVWFDDISQISINPLAFEVGLDGKCNVMDENGNVISPKLWFDKIYNFDYYNSNYYVVHKNDKINVMNNKGNLVFKGRWLNDVKIFTIKIINDILLYWDENIKKYVAISLKGVEEGL